MAALTHTEVTAYSTVSSIDADLAEAETAYLKIQDELEGLLESGKATMAAVAEVESRAQIALHARDELRGTREFLINRQRVQAEKDAAGLLYAIALCKWSGEEGGIVSSTDVTRYTTALFTANEMNGVTGVIYILQGWFAIYLEGPPAIIDRMCRELKADRSAFSLVVIVEKDELGKEANSRQRNGSSQVAGENSLAIYESTTLGSSSKHFNARAAIAREQAPSLSVGVAVGPKRRYPNESLRIVHVEETPEPLSEALHHPETTVLREISMMMNLLSFIPEFNVANRGKGRYETAKGTNLLVKNDPSCSAVGGVLASAPAPPLAKVESKESAVTKRDGAPSPFPMLARAVAMVGPYGDLWEYMESGKSLTAAAAPSSKLVDEAMISRLFKKVSEKAQSFLIDRYQRSFAAGLAGPHTQDGLYIVVESGNMSYTVDVMTDFLAELNKDDEIREVYKPLLVIDYSPDVGLVVNGVCTIVGPITRQLRKLMTVARQEVVPFLTSYRVADLADRNGCHSVGVFVIDKDPAELFTHVTQLGKIGHYAGAEVVERMRAKADAAQRAVDEHVEGPGEIERGCEKLGIRSATDREKKSLYAENDRAKRSTAFEKGSGRISYFSTGTTDAPRPPANLSSTRTVMAVLEDPSSLSNLKSISSLTSTYRGHAVMKDESAVRPVGSALNAARSAAPTGRKEDERKEGLRGERGAHAAHVVQTVSYFAPKGIQGDEEFRAMYDELPTASGGPTGAGPCATRNGFDRFYYSLEHYGTDPTPAIVDELLGKTAYPDFVTFGQFCMVMNKYQRM